MKAGPAEPVTEAVPEKARETLPVEFTLFWTGPPVDRGPTADPEPRAKEDGTAEPLTERVRWLVGDAVPFLNLGKDEETPELNGRPVLGRRRRVAVELVPFVGLAEREEDESMPELERGKPVPVELNGNVEFMNLPGLKEDKGKPELDRPVGVTLPLGLKLLELDFGIEGATCPVELVELLLRLEEEPPVGAVTDDVNADASLAMAKTTRAMSRLNFMTAR